MRAFIALAAVAAVVLAATEINFDFVSGENLTDAKSDFKFRFQKALMLPTFSSLIPFPPLPSNIYLWNSVSVDASTAGSKALASADALLGVGIPPAKGFFPVGIVGYGTGEAAAQVKVFDFKSLMEFFTGGQFSGKFDAGMVGMIAVSLAEFTPEGKYVEGTVVPMADDSCKPQAIKEEDVTGMTCTMSPSNTPAKITVTFVNSQKAGILKYGNTPVSPRSMEMIIEVNGFKLTKGNHVRMTLGLLTATGSGEIEGTTEVVRKKGGDGDAVYVAASNFTVIDGKRKEVNVEVLSDNKRQDMGSIEAFMKIAFGADVSFKLVNVDFPADESNFIYDPAAGSGSNVYLAGANTAALSLLVALVCALLYLF